MRIKQPDTKRVQPNEVAKALGAEPVKYAGKIEDKRNPDAACYVRADGKRSSFYLQGCQARDNCVEAFERLEQRIQIIRQSWEDGWTSNFDELLRAADTLRQAQAQLQTYQRVESNSELGR